MYKVALWGAGGGYNIFTSVHGHSMVEVIAIVDSKWEGYYKSIDGIPVVSPQELVCCGLYDYLVVCVTDDRIFKEIISEAVAMGIQREMILPLRIFLIPFFDFDDYIKIKENTL